MTMAKKDVRVALGITEGKRPRHEITLWETLTAYLNCPQTSELLSDNDKVLWRDKSVAGNVYSAI